jgi:hypothetical protein
MRNVLKQIPFCLAAMLAFLAAASAQTAQDTARCETAFGQCKAKCPSPVNSSGSIFLPLPDTKGVACVIACGNRRTTCLRRASVRSTRPSVGVAVDKTPKGKPPAESILNTGPGFSPQGPAATGAPVAPPPTRPVVIQ